MEKVKEFLEALRKNPRRKELCGGTEPKTEEEAIQIYLKAAEAMGFSLTAEELTEGMKALEEEQKAKTGKAEAGVSELDLAAMEAVTGGKKGHKDCEDTFKDKENCWWEDGCDSYINDYATYKCKRFWY